ncbi:MAG: vanadium-dependent haloperoxidase, partial [Bacteroidota bacterium]
DQSGQVLSGSVPPFLGAEWGKVIPFSLQATDLTIHQKEGTNTDWWVYHDPGPPPLFEDLEAADFSWYRWNFELVVKWSSHLDPNDGVIWDISPASIGNIGVENYPRNWEDYPDFYDEFEGGDPSPGHTVNPATGTPYAPNLVPRGDYARVLAEFWADGPDSETPPGHWFVIMNEAVLDHPDFERKFQGEGETLSELEFDIKAYFLLGGAMHDAAITAWGIKGYYDYIRPLSAIRLLAALGQRTDPENLAAPYDDTGINLSPGYIETIQGPEDIDDGRTFGGIKFRAWRGNRYIEQNGDPIAGVDWINAGWWEPYQRPTFVTPNFAGYLSGHSTYSSAAAQVLELLTGDAYFPGGMAEFVAPANEFLVFEEGPSVDVHLQWATYRDASDQTSLSRIWGGIHPPVDDIPGRLIGIEVGQDAFEFGRALFNGEDICQGFSEPNKLVPILTQNPINFGQVLLFQLDCSTNDQHEVEAYDLLGRKIATTTVLGTDGSFNTSNWGRGLFFLRVVGADKGAVVAVQLI